MEVRALVERVEAQLERCPPAADEPSGEIRVAAPLPAAAGPKATLGAPVRIGALCHSLMTSVLAKLKRAEQQAFY
jgi:hypothetical protein